VNFFFFRIVAVEGRDRDFPLTNHTQTGVLTYDIFITDIAEPAAGNVCGDIVCTRMI
jgi:hypothetical protein